MNYDNILKELVGIIQNHISYSSKSDSLPLIMTFLLGEKIEEGSSQNPTRVDTDIPLSASELQKIYNGKRHLPRNLCPLLASSTNWSISRLNRWVLLDESSVPALKSKLNTLYTKYFPDSRLNSINIMFRSLIHSYFFNTDEVDSLFNPCDIFQCTNYVLWTEKYEELQSALTQNHPIFITGLPGTGKTELLKYYILNEHHNPYKIAWIDDNYEMFSLNQRIQNIPFLCSENLDFDEVIDNLQDTDSSFLLIIDIPQIGENEWEFFNTYLLNLPLQVIITTHSRTIPSEYIELNLDHMPSKYLQELFTKIASKDYFSSEDYTKLWHIIDYNPYVTVLLSRLIKKMPSLNKDIFLSEEEWIWNQKGLSKIHSSYKCDGKDSELSITTLIYRMLKTYPSDFSADDILSSLSLWAKHGIILSELKLSFSEHDINLALEAGILQVSATDAAYVYMPPLIADAIWYNHPIKYKDYAPKMMEFIRSMQFGKKLVYSYHTLYQYILNMIFRFHFQIANMPSRIKKSEKERFVKWNNYLTQIIQYFILLGQHKAALDILPNLYIYQTKGNKSTSFFSPIHGYIRELISLRIQMRENRISLDEIINNLVSLINRINDSSIITKPHEQLEYDVFMLHLFSFFIDCMDYFLRTEKNIISKIIIHNDNVAENHRFLTTLNIFFPMLLRNLDSMFPNTPEYMYYQITYICFSALTNGTDFSVANNMLKTMETQYPDNQDLLFKAQLEIFYHSVIASTVIKNECVYVEYTVAETDFNSIQKTFNEKIWSWDTTWLYYSCVLLMRLYYMPLHGYAPTDQMVLECNEIISFAENQMSLDEDSLKSIKEQMESIKQIPLCNPPQNT